MLIKECLTYKKSIITVTIKNSKSSFIRKSVFLIYLSIYEKNYTIIKECEQMAPLQTRHVGYKYKANYYIQFTFVFSMSTKMICYTFCLEKHHKSHIVSNQKFNVFSKALHLILSNNTINRKVRQKILIAFCYFYGVIVCHCTDIKESYLT